MSTIFRQQFVNGVLVRDPITNFYLLDANEEIVWLPLETPVSAANNGSGVGTAVTDGAGQGYALHYGSGTGTAVTSGAGEGEAPTGVSEGSGIGTAATGGAGEGYALSYGSGIGTATTGGYGEGPTSSLLRGRGRARSRRPIWEIDGVKKKCQRRHCGKRRNISLPSSRFTISYRSSGYCAMQYRMRAQGSVRRFLP